MLFNSPVEIRKIQLELLLSPDFNKVGTIMLKDRKFGNPHSVTKDQDFPSSRDRKLFASICMEHLP